MNTSISKDVDKINLFSERRRIKQPMISTVELGSKEQSVPLSVISQSPVKGLYNTHASWAK